MHENEVNCGIKAKHKMKVTVTRTAAGCFDSAEQRPTLLKALLQKLSLAKIAVAFIFAIF